MQKRLLSVPQLIFVIGTRAALAAGVALLVSDKLKKTPRRIAGLSLIGLGAATTFPAAKILLNAKPLFGRFFGG